MSNLVMNVTAADSLEIRALAPDQRERPRCGAGTSYWLRKECQCSADFDVCAAFNKAEVTHQEFLCKRHAAEAALTNIVCQTQMTDE